jgi:SSS family solute:Na+ symporter
MKLAIVVVILLATLTGAVGYGRRTRKGHTLSDWAVGGRSLGAIIFWFMNAGEVYTTFAVLGISGYAWALGAPAYLAFCSVSMSYAIGYWLMPKIWRAGRTRQLVTQADFFAARYDATWLGVLTGVIGIASLIVYVQIQLVSLGLIVQLTLDDLISTQTATLIAGLLMITFVFVAGIRSAAFAAGVKDVLMIVVVVLLSATVAGKVGAASRYWQIPRSGSYVTHYGDLVDDIVDQHRARQLGLSSSVPDVVHSAERYRHPPQRDLATALFARLLLHYSAWLRCVAGRHASAWQQP